jgi:methylmalonyl-CoA mutase cobalamin-binding subunit
MLMAKPGLEGHWRGLMSVSRVLKDAGFGLS